MGTNSDGSSGHQSDSNNAFVSILEGRFFDGKPKKEAFAQIIDSYRLRVEDEYKFMANHRGIYNEEDPKKDLVPVLPTPKRKASFPNGGA